jgi:hypothetical protein
MGRRDLLLVGCSVVASMSMMQSHAAHPASGGGERRRSSAAEIRSMKHIVPPHFGQRHELECGPYAAVGESEASESRRRLKQMGNSRARRRLARKPKLRMRTKPCGSRCNRKRRRNSSAGRLMSFFLLPCAESRQRKVTLPSSSATSLLF